MNETIDYFFKGGTFMVTWNNLDTLASYQALFETDRVNLAEAMSGENGADRVKNYTVPMAAGLSYNYAAKQVDGKVLEALAGLAKEAQLTEKYKELYNGAVINTGEKRLVLHQLTRGQLGDAVVADGVDKRDIQYLFPCLRNISPADTGDMGCQHYAVHLPQRMLCRQRLPFCHIHQHP